MCLDHGTGDFALRVSDKEPVEPKITLDSSTTDLVAVYDNDISKDEGTESVAALHKTHGHIDTSPDVTFNASTAPSSSDVREPTLTTTHHPTDTFEATDKASTPSTADTAATPTEKKATKPVSANLKSKKATPKTKDQAVPATKAPAPISARKASELARLAAPKTTRAAPVSPKAATDTSKKPPGPSERLLRPSASSARRSIGGTSKPAGPANPTTATTASQPKTRTSVGGSSALDRLTRPTAASASRAAKTEEDKVKTEQKRVASLQGKPPFVVPRPPPSRSKRVADTNGAAGTHTNGDLSAGGDGAVGDMSVVDTDASIVDEPAGLDNLTLHDITVGAADKGHATAAAAAV